MFDSREVAKKALVRAVEINRAKRSKMFATTIATAASCICAAWLLVLAAPEPFIFTVNYIFPNDSYHYNMPHTTYTLSQRLSFGDTHTVIPTYFSGYTAYPESKIVTLTEEHTTVYFEFTRAYNGGD